MRPNDSKIKPFPISKRRTTDSNTSKPKKRKKEMINQDDIRNIKPKIAFHTYNALKNFITFINAKFFYIAMLQYRNRNKENSNLPFFSRKICFVAEDSTIAFMKFFLNDNYKSGVISRRINRISKRPKMQELMLKNKLEAEILDKFLIIYNFMQFDHIQDEYKITVVNKNIHAEEIPDILANFNPESENELIKKAIDINIITDQKSKQLLQLNNHHIPSHIHINDFLLMRAKMAVTLISSVYQNFQQIVMEINKNSDILLKQAYDLSSQIQSTLSYSSDSSALSGSHYSSSSSVRIPSSIFSNISSSTPTSISSITSSSSSASSSCYSPLQAQASNSYSDQRSLSSSSTQSTTVSMEAKNIARQFQGELYRATLLELINGNRVLTKEHGGSAPSDSEILETHSTYSSKQ